MFIYSFKRINLEIDRREGFEDTPSFRAHMKGYSMKKFVKGGVCTLASLGLIMSMGVGTALADSMDTDGLVTFAGGCGPNNVTGEVMGMSGVEDGGDPTGRDKTWTNEQLLSWNSPHYLNWGSAEYQSSPNPYMYNYLYDKTGTSKKIVMNSGGRSGDNSGGSGPNSGGLSSYGTSQDDDVWNMLPDVIIATGKLSSNQYDDSTNVYNTANLALAAGEANNQPNYRTIGVYANAMNYYDHIYQWYKVADAADTAAKNTGKKLRYGEAKLIANRLEAVMRGSQGYILKCLAQENKEKKTICLIKSVNEDGTFNLASDDYYAQTTSSTYLQVCAATCNNLYDQVTDGTATLEDLQKCDVILLGILGKADSDETIMSKLPQELQDKCYYQKTRQLGTTYLLLTRSPENFNNFCRILGCVYPEYISQSDMMAFASEQIYHIKSNKLGEYIDKAMDGVRNWSATGGEATDWDADDISGYNVGNVEKTLVEGMNYLKSLGANVPANLKQESGYSNDWATNLSKAESDLKQTIKVTGTSKTIKYNTVKKKTQTFKVTATAEGTVSFKKSSGNSKITVSKAGKVTVKKGIKKGTYKVKVKVSATGTYRYPTYAAASTNKTVTVKVK